MVFEEIKGDVNSKSEEACFETLSLEISEVAELEVLRSGDRRMFDIFFGYWNEHIYPKFASLAESNEKTGASKLLEHVVFVRDTIRLYNTTIGNLRKYSSSPEVRYSSRLMELTGYLEQVECKTIIMEGDEVRRFNRTLCDIAAEAAAPKSGDGCSETPLPSSRPAAKPGADMVDIGEMKVPLVKRYDSASSFIDEISGGGPSGPESDSTAPPAGFQGTAPSRPASKKVIEYDIVSGLAKDSSDLVSAASAGLSGFFSFLKTLFKVFIGCWVLAIVCAILYGVLVSDEIFMNEQARSNRASRKYVEDFQERAREIKERTRSFYAGVKRRSATYRHRAGSVEIEMIALPETVYWYNSPYDVPGRLRPLRRPLAAFSISKYEITNGQFAEFVRSAGYVPAGVWGREAFGSGEILLMGGRSDDPKWSKHPAVNITKKDAEEFCKWAGLRLPTEFEWQAAATGDGLDKPCVYQGEYNPEYQNLSDHISARPQYYRPLVPGRGTYQAGRLRKCKSWIGACDMMGNAAEWCDPAQYSDPEILSGSVEITMGGSFFDGSREDFRQRRFVESRRSNFHTGFRAAGPPPPGFK